MAGIGDLTIVNWNTAQARPVDCGAETTLCAVSNLTVYKRTVSRGRSLDAKAGNDYHLVYVVRASGGTIRFKDQAHAAEDGAGVLLAPSEAARFDASGADLELLHMVVPRPPAAVEAGLPGGPGYFFNRKSLRQLRDASGGRIRRFCAESSVRLRDGSRLTPTNAIQAGEMHYVAGGASPYHAHHGTEANPAGPAHCYITFAGRGLVEVGKESRPIEPGTLVYFPTGVPHRLRSHGGPLDYFEIQAWRSFRTTVLSEEPLGLKWYYEPEGPGEPRVEWNQS